MTLNEITDALRTIDKVPTRSLGQNFLHDQNLARWMVSQLAIEPGDHIVEIGPGLGALTEFLAAEARSLTVIEKDDRLIPYLNERFNSPHIHVIHGDAAEFDTMQLLGRGRIKVIGNLPYYVSTPILARFLDPLLGAERLIFTLQLELAERLSAKPRTKAYGAMTVCVGRRWRVEKLRTLPASVFYPAPKVESAVVSITPRAVAEVPPCDEGIFDKVVRCGFSERRKQLGKLLGRYREAWPGIAKSLDIPVTTRAEELSIAQWTELVRSFAPASAQNSDELFDVVDECDRVIDTLPRDEVHARNLHHRAIHVMIFNRHEELLLQKRSIWKDRNPAFWDSSTAGHVDAGETYEEAALREMREEIGVEAENLKAVAKLGCGPETGYEFLMIYTAHHEGPFNFAPIEVEGGAFFPLDQVRRWLARSPGEFTPIFQQAFPIVDRSLQLNKKTESTSAE